MPELPEVQCVIDSLQHSLVNKKVESVKRITYRLRETLTQDLEQSAPFLITDLERRGKYIVMHTDKDFAWVVHLGMTGALLVREKHHLPEKHDHLVLHFDTFDLVYNDVRKFGFVMLENNLTDNKYLKNLGIDALSKDLIEHNLLYEKTQNSSRDIKTLLLDQKTVAGLGNIYVLEALFLAGIHPQRKANALTSAQCCHLSQSIIDLLTRAIEAGGSTISDFKHGDGQSGQFQHHFNIYNRSSCPYCGSNIVKIQQSGRSSFFCPTCQQ